MAMSKYLVFFLVLIGCGPRLEFPFIVYEKRFPIVRTIVTQNHDKDRCIYVDEAGNYFISSDCSFNIGDTLNISNE